MPNCRNCGARLNKFDTDICPVCGAKDPLQGVSSETVEVTSQIDLSQMSEGQKVVRRRKRLLIYFLSFGFTGLPFFYIKKQLFGLIWLLANLVFIGGLFALLFFAAKAHLAVAIIVPILSVYAINIVTGVIYNFLPDLRDGEGEFIV